MASLYSDYVPQGIIRTLKKLKVIQKEADGIHWFSMDEDGQFFLRNYEPVIASHSGTGSVWRHKTFQDFPIKDRQMIFVSSDIVPQQIKLSSWKEALLPLNELIELIEEGNSNE